MKKEELSKEIVDYIEQQLKKGYTVNQIKARLLEFGHDEDFVNGHVSHVHRRKRMGIIVLFAILFIIVVVLYSIFNLSTVENKVPNEDTGENQATLQAALAKGDVLLCGKLSDPRDIKACGLEIGSRIPLTNNPKIDAFNKETIENATRDANAKICYTISNTPVRTNCIDQVYFNLLKNNVVNQVKCGILTNVAIKEKCIGYSILNNVMKTKSIEDCEKIIMPIGLRELCKAIR